MENDDLATDIIDEIKTVKIKCYNCEAKLELFKEDIPLTCPHCGYDRWWFKPIKERELFIAQENFFNNNKDAESFKPFYELLYSYVRILILKKLKNKKVLSKEDVDLKIQDTIGKMYIYYTDERKYPGWCIENSFAGVINLILLDVLYNRKRVFNDKITSLNQVVNDSSSNRSELQDLVKSFGYRTLYFEEFDTEKNFLAKNLSVVKDILQLIKDIVEKVCYKKDDKTALLVLVGIKYNLEAKKEQVIQDYYSHVGYEIETLIKEFMFIIRDYIDMEGEKY